jgi:hypothetical protein
MRIRSRIRSTVRARGAWRAAALALVAGLALLAGPAGAQTAAVASPIEPEAKAIIDRMASALQKAASLSVVADIAWDSVQPDGQKLEFGETRRIAVRRPDRMRIETERRSGEKRGTVYDGKEIAVFDYDAKAFASVPKTGTIDDAIDYAQNDLGVRVPLAQIFSAELGKTLSEEIREASRVDVARVGGIVCDHVAVRTDTVDAQFWVAQGDTPVARRIVISYRNELGQPQFRADLRDWDLKASHPDSLFSVAAPAGSERVPLATPPSQPEAGR